MPHDIIMPALGMAQDTGLLVRWCKAPGDAVQADDVLFEVETDKSTIEVPAGHDGFLGPLLADEGAEIPVGQTITTIGAEKPSAEQTSAPEAKAPAEAKAPEPAASGQPAPETTAPAPKASAPAQSQPSQPQPAQAASGGRVLASPKARRLASEQGLDLGRLVAAGHPQPYHTKDLDVLRALPEAARPGTAAAGRRLTAKVRKEGFTDFADWAAAEVGLTDSDALLAGLAAASLARGSVVVRVQTFDRDRLFAAGHGTLTDVEADVQADVHSDTDGPPDLVLRDLRYTRLTALSLGPEACPVLSLTGKGSKLTVTLECAADQLGAPQAISLLSAFAGRLEHPLRHLL